jgi:hypothetical protein
MNPILKAHCENGRFSHGYLLLGDHENMRLWARQAAGILLGCEESSLDSHPDFYEIFLDVFDLDQGRDLRQKIMTRPVFAAKKVFLLGAESFNDEAVIGLARIFEEPPETSHFFLISSLAENVPLVLRSRLVCIFEKGSFELNSQKRDFYEKFFKANPGERMLLVKNIAADKNIALEFLNEVEVILGEKIKKEQRQSDIFKNLLFSLEELQKNRRFLFDRAPSPRMIIEHFALTLPQL